MFQLWEILEKFIYDFHRRAIYQRNISENTNDWNLSHIYEMEDYTYDTSDIPYDI